MKLAIMQPYFFPYIGYWQLIYAADRFVNFQLSLAHLPTEQRNTISKI